MRFLRRQQLGGEVALFHTRPAGLAGEDNVPLADADVHQPGVQADEHRFRPNIVVETSGVMPLENTWLGKTLAIGKQVVLRASQPTERCVMTTYAQSDLPFDPRILKGIAQHADLCFGIYAQVLVRGTIRCGDSVSVVD